MRLSRKQFVDGVSAFVDNEVIKSIPDTNLKVLISAGWLSICGCPAVLDRYVFNNIIFTTFEDNGTYDLDSLISNLKSSIERYGNFTIKIPSVPLISKEEKQLSFSSSDVECLRGYLERSVG